MKKETEQFIQEKSFFDKGQLAIYVNDLQKIIHKEVDLLYQTLATQSKKIIELKTVQDNRVTVRDQFAMRAMEGLILRENKDMPMDVYDIVRLSYLIADEMLEARKKNQK